MSKRKGVLAALLLVSLVAVHWDSTGAPDGVANPLNVIDSLYEVGLAAAILLLAAGIGLRLLKIVRADVLLDERETPLFAIPLGLTLLGYVSWAISLGRMYNAPTLLATVLLLAAIFRQDMLTIARSITAWRPGPTRWRPESVAIAVVILALLTVTLLRALAPPTDYDALMYHLAGPARYLQSGQYLPWLPNLPQSAFPFSLEMVFGLGMALGNDSVPALLCYALGLITCGSLLCFASRFINQKRAGLYAVLALLSTTYVIETMGIAGADPLWILSEFMALYALIAWRRQRNNRWLVLAGAMLGVALTTKYLAIEGCLLAALVVADTVVIRWRQPVGRGICAVALLALVTTAVCLPWYAKNWLFFGNPVYPFAFGGHAPSFAVDPATFTGSYGMGRSWLDYLLLPVRIYLHSNLFSENPASIPTVLAWLLPAYAFMRKDSAVSGLILWTVARFLLWAILPQNLRYFGPVHPALVLSIGYILAQLAGSRRAILSLAASGLALAGLLISMSFLRIRDSGWNLPYVLGLESRQNYLERELGAISQSLT